VSPLFVKPTTSIAVKLKTGRFSATGYPCKIGSKSRSSRSYRLLWRGLLPPSISTSITIDDVSLLRMAWMQWKPVILAFVIGAALTLTSPAPAEAASCATKARRVCLKRKRGSYSKCVRLAKSYCRSLKRKRSRRVRRQVKRAPRRRLKRAPRRRLKKAPRRRLKRRLSAAQCRSRSRKICLKRKRGSYSKCVNLATRYCLSLQRRR